jgi:omega-6 fatty acid desaturase (delta-12 desaturase)
VANTAGRALILETRAYAQDVSLKSWWCILSTGFLLVSALAGALLHLPLAIRISCSGLAGFLSLRLFVIYHDHQHHAILPRSKVAALLMRIFGVWALSPSSVWRSSHNYHHKHNSKLRGSHIGSFPIMTKEQYLNSSGARQRYYLFVRHPLTILFGYVFVFLYSMVLYPFCNSPRKHYDCLLSFILHVVTGVMLVLLFDWQSMLLALVLPHFIAAAIGSYLFYAQHNFPGGTFTDNAGWTYEKAALRSSSYLKTGPLMAWFTANIGYHHVHHLNARVPFYRLPEVVKNIPELGEARTTSLHPMDIIRCLRLKVWDAKSQTMVGIRDI